MVPQLLGFAIMLLVLYEIDGCECAGLELSISNNLLKSLLVSEKDCA